MTYNTLATCSSCAKYGRTNESGQCRSCAKTALHPAIVPHYVTVPSNTGTHEEPTEFMLPAQLDRGLAAILLGTHCNGRQGQS